MELIWSDYQKNIFQNIKFGTGHVIIEALAGSSKTTTIIESLKYVPENCKWLLVAFNKNIAEELKSRAPKSDKGEVSTFHSLGLRSIFKTFKNVKVDNDKCTNIIKTIIDEEEKELQYQLKQAVSLSKYYLAHTAEEIDEVLDIHDVEFGDLEREEFIKHVLTILDLCKSQTNTVDFDDMIYFPNVLKLKVPKYDMVLVDEYQDMNKAQAEFILKTIKGYPKNKKQGRLILLGDKNQNLYEFRGSNSSMHDEFKQKLNAKTLPLSITYRCPKLIVKEANKIVPELECAPNAIDGKISYISEQELKNIAKPGCFILSRVNAPLIGLALYFISNGIPANIQGRDLGKNLLSLIKKSKKKKLDSFLEYLEKWKEKEVTRLVKMERDTSHVYDKYDCFIALSESANTMDELKNNIEKLFADTNEYNKIVLSSVHRSKGKERNTVFLLKKTFRFNTQSERNIYYVATTRSKSELYLVS